MIYLVFLVPFYVFGIMRLLNLVPTKPSCPVCSLNWGKSGLKSSQGRQRLVSPRVLNCCGEGNNLRTPPVGHGQHWNGSEQSAANHNLISDRFICIYIFFSLSGKHGGMYHPVILCLAQFLGLRG